VAVVGAVTAASTVRCATCAGTVVDTETGWTHVDGYGRMVGWLCPLPHMSLATPAPVPGPPASTPAWVDALQAVPPRRHQVRQPPEWPI
jgi:hypothetical protein